MVGAAKLIMKYEIALGVNAIRFNPISPSFHDLVASIGNVRDGAGGNA